MAVNPTKLLPPSASTSIIKRGSLVPSIIKSKPDVGVNEEGTSSLLVIKKKVVEIDKLLKGGLLLKKETEKRNKIQSEKDEYEKRESELETKKPKDELKNPSLNLPSLGIFDVIKRFLFFTTLGRFLNIILEFKPKIVDFTGKIAPIIDFFEKFTGNFFKGVIDFIDFGYDAYDKVRAFTKQIGGEPFQKTFDEFSKNLNTFINLAIVAGIAATGGTDFKKKGKPGIPGEPGGISKPTRTPKGYRLPGGQGRYLKEDRIAQFDRRTKGFGERLSQRSRITQQQFIQRPLRNITRPARQLLGKTGTRIAKGVFGRVPVIGGLIDFALSLYLGEKPGRAAAKAVGATIGSALGTFIPVPFAGTILGGILGDIVGGALYDTLISNQRKNPVQKKATGGSVTRGGKRVGSPAIRRIKTKPIKRRIKPQETKPGQNVGGENQIKKLFPDPMRPIKPEVKADPDAVNPLGTLKKVSENLKDIPFLGGIMGASVDVAMGQKPDSSLFTDYGNVIGNLVQTTIDNKVDQSISEIIKSTIAMAEGGEVISRSIDTKTNIGQEIGNQIAKLLSSNLNNRINTIFNDIIKQFEKKPLGGDSEIPAPPPDDSDFSISGGSEDFWTLVAIVSREDASPQGSADVAQSIYNRAASGAYGSKSIRGLILRKTQYQPTWEYPKKGQYGIPNPEWRVIKDADSAAAAAGMSVGAIKSVAKNILNPTLQKNAKEFVQGRTDFKAQGQGVSGISRDSQSNVFGWHYNYRENKVAAVPSFGATVVSKPRGGFDIKIDLGKGYGSDGSKIAGQLGRYIYKVLKTPQQFLAVTEHPEFGGITGRHVEPGYQGYHKSGRAIDIGAYAREQGAVLKAIVDFNKANKLKPVQLLHAGNDKSGEHDDHVHVAYQGGGLISSNQTRRDMSSLKARASYEGTGSMVYVQTLIVEKPIPVPVKGSGLSNLSIPFSD